MTKHEDIRVTYIFGLPNTGSTAYGEHLCEKHNKQGEKTLWVGEGIVRWRMHVTDDILSRNYCSCQKHITQCPFWKNAEHKPDLKTAADWILTKARQKGYKHVIDTSKHAYPLHAYQKTCKNVTTVWKHRDPFSWAKSRTQKTDNSYIWNFIEYFFQGIPLLIRFLKNADNKSYEGFNRYKITRDHNEHKHCYAGNPSKFHKEIPWYKNRDENKVKP